MEQKNKNINKNSTRVAKNRLIIVTSVAVMLVLVLILGAVVGTVAIVRNAQAVVKYSGVSVDKGVASYLASTYKTVFMQKHSNAEDAKSFWESQVPYMSSVMTYGELLELETLDYVKSVVVGAYLFDRYSSLSDAESDAIARACEEVLADRVGGNESEFDKDCSEMGFTYEDFKCATELIYKSEQTKSIIYGTDGVALNNPDRYSECDSYYYDKFSCVEILFIPTKIELMVDDDGNLQKDANGIYKYQYYTQAEIAERKADILEIRRLIEGYRNQSGEQISGYYFDSMQEKYNINHEFDDTGYYFAPESTFFKNFAEDSSEFLPQGYSEAFYKCMNAIRYNSFALSPGQYNEVEGDYGVAFIYRRDNQQYGYLSVNHTAQFHDFFSDAADYLYEKMMSELLPAVEVREDYYDISVTEIPYNFYYIAKVGVVG